MLSERSRKVELLFRLRPATRFYVDARQTIGNSEITRRQLSRLFQPLFGQLRSFFLQISGTQIVGRVRKRRIRRHSFQMEDGRTDPFLHQIEAAQVINHARVGGRFSAESFEFLSRLLELLQCKITDSQLIADSNQSGIKSQCGLKFYNGVLKLVVLDVLIPSPNVRLDFVR